MSQPANVLVIIMADRIEAFCRVCGWSTISMGKDESSRGSIRAFEAEHAHEKCELCGEDILPDEDTRMVGPGRVHRECVLRFALGGIGHLEDHELWCIQRGDPNGGRTYRQSALEVDAWVVEHGVGESG